MTALRDYFELVKTYPRFLLFGMLHMFFSSPGQSYTVAIFVPALAASFGLGSSGFGLLYSTATLISACLIPFFGALLDRVNLRVYSICVGLLMAAGGIVTATAPNIPILFIGILALRFSGQGLMTQIAGVSTTRFFSEQRGKALAIIGLGFAFGIAALPMALAHLITAIGWQKTMMVVSGSILLIFMPISLGLLKKTDRFQHPPQTDLDTTDESNQTWTRRDVLKTPFFYFALPLALLIPFVSTGLIIHIGRIAEYKGWTMEWVAACFVVSAVVGRLGSFIMGPIVDRFTARRLFPYILIPYAFGLTVVALAKSPLAVVIWFSLSGLSAGFMIVTMSVLWAEIFGVRSLGTVTSLVASITVFASALSPFLFGWLLDHGTPVPALILASVALVVCCTFVAFMAPAPGERRVYSSAD